MLEGQGLRPQGSSSHAANVPEALDLASSQTSAATLTGAPAMAIARTFPFDFFEHTQCVSRDVRLSADPTQPGTQKLFMLLVF